MPEPRERPLIFSGESVRAILAGRKTQTRRIAARADWNLDGFAADSSCAYWTYPNGNRGWSRCPQGVPGDRLWVREAFSLENCHEAGWSDPPHNDGRPLKTNQNAGGDAWWEQPHYRATDAAPELSIPGSSDPGPGWRTPLFMPRWASRLTLEIVEIRVQRLQEISEEDAQAEGVERDRHGWRDYLHPDAIPQATAADSFCTAWQKINGKRAPWSSNPWVWVIALRKLEAPRA